MESKLFSDLTVKCNDGNAFAHKLILQARIQNFCNDFQVDEETSLISVDTTCQVFQSFLQLIYTDTVKLSPEQNELFCKFVSQYNLNRVEKLNLEIESVLEEVMVSSLSVDMMKLLSTSLKFTDIKFHITEGNHIVSSYKSILAIRCSYFRAIFNFHQAPSNKQEQILEISNISLPTFQAALHYLYTDTGNQIYKFLFFIFFSILQSQLMVKLQ